MSANTESATEEITESNGFKDWKKSFVAWLEFIFKVGLGVGSVIAFCFYFFYVRAMPSIGNIGDITIFLIMIAGIGIIISGVFVVGFMPALWLDNKSYVKYLEKEVHLCKHIKVTSLFFWFVALANIGWIWLDVNIGIFIFIDILILIKIYFIFFKDKQDKQDPVSFFIITFIYVISIFLYSWISLNEPVIDSILFIAITTLSNVMILKTILEKIKKKRDRFLSASETVKDLNDDTELDEQFYRWFPIGCAFSVICYLSLILVNQHKDVFFITKSFELLKLGHYNATLQFKEDFIQKDNPFKSNLKNCKEGYFFIRSSIGDEYILQEFEERKENNTTKKEPLKLKPDVYRIKKEFVLTESDTNTTDMNKTWAIENGCDSYEKVTFKKEFIKNNNPFMDNVKGCLTRTFWVRDRGTTVELKDNNDTNSSEPYQISTKYIMSRQKTQVQDQNTTWTDCPPKPSKPNAPSAVLCQIRCDNNQSKNDK